MYIIYFQNLPLFAIIYGFISVFSGTLTAAQVDFVDNIPLTKKSIFIPCGVDSNTTPRNNFFPFPLPLPQEIQENTLISEQIEPIYTTTQVKTIFRSATGENWKERAGTGFFALDRSKEFDGTCRPFNLAMSDLYKDSKQFPRTYLITNRHVLNLEPEDFMDNQGMKWNKTHYSFYIHLVKRIPTSREWSKGEVCGWNCHFKTAYITIPFSTIDVHYLPERSLNETAVKIDLAAIDLKPFLNEINSHILNRADLQGYEIFFHAFDRHVHFSNIPEMGEPIQTFGYPLTVVGGGMLPNYSLGYISSSIETIFNMNGHLMVSDGCCSLDIPGGASGSPIFYEKKYKESEAYFALYKSFKLAGVAFSSRNTLRQRIDLLLLLLLNE